MGSFTEEESVTFDTIEETIKNGRQERLLLPMVRGLQHLKRLSVDEEGMKARILHGQNLSKPDSVVKVEPFIFMFNDQLLAIYQIHPEKPDLDRKSTRLNSSHVSISYAVFCLKKKNNKK